MEGKTFLDFMPEQASSWASRVDFINNFITYVAAFCTIAITATMLWFAWKYRRRPGNEKGANITHDATLETVWTVIPTLICIFVCYYGFVIYREMRNVPANPVEINVEGYQWGWSYTYPNGKTAGKDLVVPVGKPVRLIMRSKDVNHSFFIPAMRVKEDVLASEYHYLWFTAIKTGEFHIFCTEYCGQDHSGMIGTLKVVSDERYQDYINDRSKEEIPPEVLGGKIYAERGCKACHSLDGTAGIGPTWKGIFGTQVVCEDGGTFTRDESYIKESILHPQAKIVKGYGGDDKAKMQSFAGQLSDKDVDAVIAYMKTLKN